METAAITVRWKINDVAKLLADDSSANSPKFDNERWHLRMVCNESKPEVDEDLKKCSIYLYASPQSEELSQPNGEWERDVESCCSLKSMSGRIILEVYISRPFTKKNPAWGRKACIEYSAIREALAYDHSDRIIFECTLYTRASRLEPSIVRQPTLYDSLENLFEDSTTDVVLRIRSHAEDQSEHYLYAHKGVLEAHSNYFSKLFSTGFSESAAIVKFGDLPQSTNADFDKDTLEADDDSQEWLEDRHDVMNGSETDTNEGAVEEARDVAIAPESTVDSSAETNSGAAAVATVSEEVNGVINTRAGSADPNHEVSVEERMTERNLREVVVVDAGWTTYRALIYWMYTHKLCLTRLHSDYLVYLASLASDSSGPRDKEVATSTSIVSSRRTWLLAQAEKDGQYSPKTDTIKPASPHAIYRLADKLDISDAKEAAKSAIMKGYTIENILYELISTFSYHYCEMQDAALAFALQYWEQVKLTSAFKEVVAGSCMGRIEGASEIWMKLLGKLTVGPSTVPQKRATPSS